MKLLQVGVMLLLFAFSFELCVAVVDSGSHERLFSFGYDHGLPVGEDECTNEARDGQEEGGFAWSTGASAFANSQYRFMAQLPIYSDGPHHVHVYSNLYLRNLILRI